MSPTCKIPSDCSPSIALLNIQDGNDVRQCVGSLIADNLIVTASHCLPEELRHARVNCKGSIRALFPATSGYSSLQADCEEVVSATPFSDRTLAQQDYALLRLAATTGRPSFKIDHSGFNSETTYRVIRSEQGQLFSEQCHTIRRSEVLPGSDHPESSVMVIADCEIKSSSEGAPLLDSAGGLHGVLQSVVPLSRIARRVSPHAVPESGISTLSYATNFSCVRFPLDDENLAFPSACQADPNEPNPLTETDKTQSLISQCNQLTNSRFQWPNLSSDFQWGTQAFLSSSSEGQTMSKALGWTSPNSISIFTIPFPKCLMPGTSFAATNFKLPVVGYKYMLDRYLILGVDRGRSLDSVHARFEINPPQPRWGGGVSSHNKYINLFVGSGNLIIRAPLPTCSRSDSGEGN